ncbi:MAG: ATP-binding cassette domain-containing protein [bacterium]|nr:ATP-binding cassette domain-containing protein [bacterium]
MSYATIIVEDVYKTYGSIQALNGVSLWAESGRVLGLLGPNGAGKTTLVRILTTLLHPDAGRATVAGIDVAAHPERVRPLIGLAGQYPAVDELLTGRENLVMVGQLYHLSGKEARRRADELLERFTLTDAANRPIRTYSGGMRRRLDLAASIVARPQVLFLDEPTTGLDPRTRMDLWDFIRELVRDGATLLLTTQYLEEADRLADRIVLINRGKVAAEGTSDELKAQLASDVIDLRVEGEAALRQAAAVLTEASQGKLQIDADAWQIKIPAPNGAKSLIEVVRLLDGAGVAVSDITLQRPSLDDVFLALTGEKAGETNAAAPVQH